ACGGWKGRRAERSWPCFLLAKRSGPPRRRPEGEVGVEPDPRRRYFGLVPKGFPGGAATRRSGHGGRMPSFPSPGTPPSILVRPTSPGAAVAAAALAVLIGAGVRLALGDLVGGHGVFLLFVPAVVAGAALGGRVPGLIATALG